MVNINLIKFIRSSPHRGEEGGGFYSALMLSTGLAFAIPHVRHSTQATMSANKTMPVSTYIGHPAGTCVENMSSHR